MDGFSMLLFAATFSSAASFSLGRVAMPTAPSTVRMSAIDDAEVSSHAVRVRCGGSAYADRMHGLDRLPPCCAHPAATLLPPCCAQPHCAICMPQAKARWLAGSGTPSWGANEVDEAAELISKLKIEAGNLHARGTQLDAVVAELEAELKVHQRMAAAASMMGGTRDSSDDVQANNRGGQTAEGMAHSCLDDGCPVNTVSDLIAELKVTLALALTLTLTTDP